MEEIQTTLTALAGATTQAVTVSLGNQTQAFTLMAPQPQDFYEAKEYMVKDRTRKAIMDTEGLLDPETRAKLIAEIRTRCQTHISVLLEEDGILFMTFLMAKRGGFPGNFEGFRLGVQGANFGAMQTALFKMCDIEVGNKGEAPSANPSSNGTIAP